MPHILVVGALHADAMAQLDARPDVTYETVADAGEAELIARAAGADAFTVRTQRIPAAVIDAAPALKVVSRHGVGYDNVDLAALDRRGIPLTVTATANAVTVAEHSLSLMLALAKHTIAFDAAVRGDRWGDRLSRQAWELAERTLLIVGFGRIGRELAARARAFGMDVVVYDPFVDAAAAAAAGVGHAPDLMAALEAADVVSLHLPRTPETEGLIGAAELAAMRPTAVLINAARGGLIDEAALAAALKAGEIAGAGLDTFAVEPPAADHPLFALDNVVLSPHIGGVTGESLRRMGLETVANTLAALDGALDPAVVVNRQVLGQA